MADVPSNGRAVSQGSQNRCGDFLSCHSFHAAKIYRAHAQETRTAFDVMTNDHVPGAERARQAMLGRTKDCNCWHAQECGQVHRAGVVRQQKAAVSQLCDQIFQTRQADAIDTVLADPSSDLLPNGCVSRRAEEMPSSWLLRSNGDGRFRESFR